MQKQLTIKIVIIAVLTILLLIPLTLIESKIEERSRYLSEAKNNVSQSWTSSQTVMTALMVIPYEVTKKYIVKDQMTGENKEKFQTTQKKEFVIPNNITIDAALANQIRQKGIFRIPVNTTAFSISGEFSQQQLADTYTKINNKIQAVAGGKIHQPFLATTISDPRGINSIPTLTWQARGTPTKSPFEPGSKLAANRNGIHALLPAFEKSSLVNTAFNFDFELRGMESVSFIPLALQAKASARSDWPHPQFTGAFLPVNHEINNQGYQATWQVTSFASNIADKVSRCKANECQPLFDTSFGVKHIEPVNVYLQSERSVKYGLLFIGLSFVTFFILEVVLKLPIHPIQYGLVGLAIAVFYLLLISLSEHINFLLSYVIASIACTLLLYAYLKHVLKSNKHALVFGGFLGLLYATLYVIISAEDFALIMGTGLTFITLMIVMMTTRKIDWYDIGGQKENNA